MEVVLVLSNIVLVLITGWYAYQTYQTVVEMRESRRAAVRPHLSLDLEPFGSSALAKIENVGAGAALDVTAAVELQRSNAPTQKLEWQTSVLRPGESRVLHVPSSNGAGMPSIQDLRAVGAVMTLSGNCKSATGESIVIDDTVEFTAQTRNEITVSSSTEVSERLKKVVDSLEKIARAVSAGK